MPLRPAAVTPRDPRSFQQSKRRVNIDLPSASPSHPMVGPRLRDEVDISVTSDVRHPHVALSVRFRVPGHRRAGRRFVRDDRETSRP